MGPYCGLAMYWSSLPSRIRCLIIFLILMHCSVSWRLCWWYRHNLPMSLLSCRLGIRLASLGTISCSIMIRQQSSAWLTLVVIFSLVQFVIFLSRVGIVFMLMRYEHEVLCLELLRCTFFLLGRRANLWVKVLIISMDSSMLYQLIISTPIVAIH